MPHEQPLQDYLVVDFTSVVAGPWCTRLLADCGARVIKVEPPGMGDVLRFSPPLAEGQSRTYAHFNCGKESVALDLKHAQGVKLARSLIDRADIVVENFRPGVMQRLGLDHAAVADANPRLIYCSISGFGQTGPQAQAPAYAPVVQALSGFDHVWRIAQGHDVPLNAAIMVADFVAAGYAFGAIQSAVIRRERFGLGAHLDVTLMESMLSLVAIQCQEAQWDNEIRSTVFRPVQVHDGFVMIPLVSQRNYLDLLAAMGDTRLSQGPRMASFSGVLEARGEILKALGDWARDLTSEEIVARMEAAGLPCARYQTPAQVLTDPHLTARGSFATAHDARGPFQVGCAPFRFGTEPLSPGPKVAALGEHTDRVLEDLGVSRQQTDQLRAAGAVD